MTDKLRQSIEALEEKYKSLGSELGDDGVYIWNRYNELGECIAALRSAAPERVGEGNCQACGQNCWRDDKCMGCGSGRPAHQPKTVSREEIEAAFHSGGGHYSWQSGFDAIYALQLPAPQSAAASVPIPTVEEIQGVVIRSGTVMGSLTIAQAIHALLVEKLGAK